MIAAVWLMSALVCIPPLLGWRVTRPPERFPQCKVFIGSIWLRSAAVMIAAVWLMSALVCIPPLLGWRVTRPPERFPQCKVSFVTNATRSVSARCRIVS
ncbi:unnamed protein product [Plutella xylostella]|uniref:(diamondback moth) hypothetical protein n=1 Tax=Plutella xylostella TaxID=51655 RepID=A0A8S4ES12_PLUXY|nr:unnamed protein product [Plutella xylostella]